MLQKQELAAIEAACTTKPKIFVLNKEFADLWSRVRGSLVRLC